MSKEKYASLPRAVRVDDEVHEVLTAIAALERRSVSNLIGLIIVEYVNKNKDKLPKS